MLRETGVCQAKRAEEIIRGQIESNHEETFLLLRDGSVQSVLPGYAAEIRPNVTGMIRLRRGAAVAGDAGAGCVTQGTDRAMGGWCSYQCRLLSGRRFVSRHGFSLIQGRSAEDVLTFCVRQALAETFALADQGTCGRKIWQEGKRLTEEKLLDCGWQLMRFTPRHLQIEGERM